MQANKRTQGGATFFYACIPMEPIGKGRGVPVKIGGFARVLTPAKTRKWEKLFSEYVAQEMAKQGKPPFSGPLTVQIDARFTLPASKHRKRVPVEGSPHVGKPDVDNVCKAVLDSLNGVLWGDDASVCSLHATKYTLPQGAAGYVGIQVERYVDNAF